MIVEITSVEVNKNQVVIEATNLETVFTAEDLFVDIPEEKVRFICQGQAKCKNAKSMGEKIEALVGCIISLSESFIEKPITA